MHHYNCWVPPVRARSRKPALIRLFTDVDYVSPWAYLVLPAIMALFAATSSSMQTLPALAAAAMVSATWVVATRARFALAANADARRTTRLTLVPTTESRKAA